MGGTRAVAGKNANKYYIFKNDARRKAFRTLNVFFNIFYSISAIMLVVGFLSIVFGLILPFFIHRFEG